MFAEKKTKEGQSEKNLQTTSNVHKSTEKPITDTKHFAENKKKTQNKGQDIYSFFFV